MGAVLLVEDKDPKYEAIKEVLLLDRPDLVVCRAKTVVEAERLLLRDAWTLLLLDVSMDINGTSQGALGGGHANLGGLDVLDTMYYEAIEVPTIIVTGFDYFIASASGEESEYIGMAELQQLAQKRIGEHLRGCVRYGSPMWVDQFQALLGGVKW